MLVIKIFQRFWLIMFMCHPANSFTSSRTNVTHPITTHADCKSMNLIYQLQCTECNAFYIGETSRCLSDRMNGHWFTTTVSNPDLPVVIHTQSHQIPFQKCWSVNVIHKLPDSTSAVNLKLHTNLSSNPDTSPVSTFINPPHSTLGPMALKVSIHFPVFYCQGRPLWSGRNIHFRFVSSLYVLPTLTSGPDDALVSLR